MMRAQPPPLMVMLFRKYKKSGSYRVKLRVNCKGDPFDEWFPGMPSKSGTIRAPEESVKHHIPNSLFFLITFGASKASRGYSMSDEVGWRLFLNKVIINRNYTKSMRI
jgi:hypothetical protein